MALGLVLLEDESEAPGGGGGQAGLYPSENPRARRGGRRHPTWRGWGGSPCCPSGSGRPPRPAEEGRWWWHLWTSALFRREVNLNWSYRGSWLENRPPHATRCRTLGPPPPQGVLATCWVFKIPSYCTFKKYNTSVAKPSLAPPHPPAPCAPPRPPPRPNPLHGFLAKMLPARRCAPGSLGERTCLQRKKSKGTDECQSRGCCRGGGGAPVRLPCCPYCPHAPRPSAPAGMVPGRGEAGRGVRVGSLGLPTPPQGRLRLRLRPGKQLCGWLALFIRV